MSSAKLAKEAIDRIMKLKEFTVRVPVEEGWLPHGVVPFNITIKKGIATVTVPALNKSEAHQIVEAYIKGVDDTDV